MSLISKYAEILHENINDKKNEDSILEIITKTDLKTRIQISQYYKATYNNSLFDDIFSKLGGDFGYCAGQLFLSPLEFCIHHLKKGLDKSNECTMEQLTSKTNEELKLIEDTFNKMTGKDLKKEILKAYKGSVGNNLVNLWEIKRIINTNPDGKECENYANILAKNNPKNWIEDENIFKSIFIQRSPEELILIARYYLKITGKNLLDDIENKLGGIARLLLKEILFNNIIPQELFAEKIYLSIKGLGTDEEMLSRVLVSRCELDMAEIRDIYKKKYDNDLKEDVIGDASGAYQKLCIFLSEK